MGANTPNTTATTSQGAQRPADPCVNSDVHGFGEGNGDVDSLMLR